MAVPSVTIGKMRDILGIAITTTATDTVIHTTDIHTTDILMVIPRSSRKEQQICKVNFHIFILLVLQNSL